ncbi:hypothetical protein [Enterobacter ludwigii]|uniref:hypothetical protein n=1 Tax=Enterobacter ludwigii TaxID=299767 RepID=UPI0013D32352|nr:hypothetical protein [Enterobacter ludwigii]
MRLIEVLRQFKPGLSIFRSGSSINAIPVFVSHEALHAFLVSMADADLTADDWVITGEKPGPLCFGFDPGHQFYSRCRIEHIEPQKLPFSSEHLLTVLRRELDIPDRRDVIVRELWLAMQLLATPESCADFMRRSLVVG